MTVLGKIMTFMIFILTLAWGGLVVNAFVTRTNWRVLAEKSKAIRTEAEASANALKNEIDTTRSAYEDQIRALRDENTRLYQQVRNLTEDRDSLQSQHRELYASVKGEGTKINQLQTNVERLQTQIDNADELLRKKESEIVRLILSDKENRVSALKASLDRDSLSRQADRLDAKIQELNEELESLRRVTGSGRRDTGLLGDRTPPAPSGFRGSISKVSASGSRGEYIVEFTPGLDTGLQKGTILKVQRRSGATGKYIGKLTVTIVEPKVGAGRIVLNPSVGPDEMPHERDELVPDGL